MALSRDKEEEVVAVALALDMGLEATQDIRSIHRLDMCSLVCDMLKLIDMVRTPGLHCICMERRWMLCAESG